MPVFIAAMKCGRDKSMFSFKRNINSFKRCIYVINLNVTYSISSIFRQTYIRMLGSMPVTVDGLICSNKY